MHIHVSPGDGGMARVADLASPRELLGHGLGIIEYVLYRTLPIAPCLESLSLYRRASSMCINGGR